jgi:hypothetical protein
MKYLTYHLISPEGYKIDYMTHGQKKESTLKELIEGHEMRVSVIESYGWMIEKIQEVKVPEQTQIQTDPICGIHKVPMTWKTGVSKSTNKPYAFWACSERMPDGSFCKYKPIK